MTETYLLLGSNQGDRSANIAKAVLKINRSVGEVVRRSALYQTAAWGNEEQPDFYNQAVLVHTGLSPLDLLRMLKHIETETGRVLTEKWGPRMIDIDILFYGHETVSEPELIIPHPYMERRRFTLMPLSEIASEWIHPVSHKSVEQLLEECPDVLEVQRISGE